MNSEIDVEPLATAYRQDLSELMVLLTQQHREEFEILQFGAGIMADDIVVFMPYGYRWVCFSGGLLCSACSSAGCWHLSDPFPYSVAV